MLLFWILFILFIATFLALDLGFFHRKDSVVHFREAILWTILWVVLSLLFSIAIYFIYENQYMGNCTTLSGSEAFLSFLAGYLIEKSLSLDNIFLFAAIFSFFEIPAKNQHRVLFWGIFGAIVLRGFFIWIGAALLHEFSGILYIFGALLLFSAFRMIRKKRDDGNQDMGYLVYKIKTLLPVSNKLHGNRFFIRINYRTLVTPLFLALVSIELSDVLFAVDSIPAIFSITQDPFIVFTSNIMAILGMRSLFFALADLLRKFRMLKYSIAFILAFTGIKILLQELHPIPTGPSLLVIGTAILAGILLSGKRISANRKTPD